MKDGASEDLPTPWQIYLISIKVLKRAENLANSF